MILESLEPKWWEIAKLPAKYGGFGLRSGLSTLGAQHTVSIAKCAPAIQNFIPNFDPLKLTAKETLQWLQKQLKSPTVDLHNLMNKAQKPKTDDEALSLSQLCESYEEERVLHKFNTFERLHIRSMSGKDHAWVSTLPLSFLGYRMTPSQWTTAARRRLLQDVIPRPSECTATGCRGICDQKGEHALHCPGSGHRILRHDRVRDIIANTAREAGLTVEIEHNGGLGGKKRPGDIWIQNWAGGKDALVDVAIIHPTAKVHRSNLLNGLPGDVAQEHSKKQKHGKAANKDLINPSMSS